MITALFDAITGSLAWCWRLVAGTQPPPKAPPTKDEKDCYGKYEFVDFPSMDLCSSDAYIGSKAWNDTHGIVVETEEIVADPTKKLSGVWNVETIDGWPIYSVGWALTDEQRLDDRHWPRDAAGKLSDHWPISSDVRLQPGTLVVWKGNFLDYAWDDGVVVERSGRLYIESPGNPDHWGVPDACSRRKCWVVRGANYTPGGCEGMFT